MKFFAVAIAAFAAAVSAGSYDAEVCSIVTVTSTVYATKPYHVGPTAPAPYPIPSGTGAPHPSVPASSGTGYPHVPSSSPAPYYPIPSGTGSPVYPSGTAAPSGTGVYTPSPPEFTGAASAVKVPAAIAGVAGLVAFFL